jgi:hypothetical protein
LSIDPAILPLKRRSNLRVILPALVVVVLALAWSGFWYVAAGRAEAGVNGFLADEAAKGRTLTCKERSFGGFPFRLEMRCSEPHLQVTRQDGSFSASAKDLVAVVQIYEPNHLIAEAAGPLLVTPDAGGAPVEAAWSKAEASLVYGLAGPSRLSVVAEGLALQETLADEKRELVRDGRLEAHMRQSEGADAAPGAYDIVARIDAGDMPPLDQIMGGSAPAKVEFQATVTGLQDLSPKPIEDKLREWQAAGGALKVVLARIDRGPTTAEANGEVALDGEGRPTGHLAIALAGVPEFAKSLKKARVAPPGLINVVSVGLGLMGKPTNIDGRPAVEVPLTLGDGRAVLGAFPLGDTPRLF